MTTSDIRTYTLEAIEPDQVEHALAVLDSAARWLAGKGIEQWPLSFTESPHRSRRIEEEAERGNVFVAFAFGSTPIGTFTLTDWQDPDFASGWPEGEVSAQYLTRLAVSHTGRRTQPHLGTRLIADAAEIAANVHDADVLRLDCAKTNTRLHEYYLDHEFDRVGRVDVPGRKSGALFERQIR